MDRIDNYDMYHDINKKMLNETGFWGKRGVGAIIFSSEAKRFMLGYRSKDVHMMHTWGTFGGAVDGDETDIEALKNELIEEIGLFDDKILDIIDLYTFKSKKGFVYKNFVVVVKDMFVPSLNWENDEYVWLTLDELIGMKKLHVGVREIVNDADVISVLRKVIDNV